MNGELIGEAQHDRARLFEATRWSMVLRARDKSAVALNSLCESYRQPLLIWLRKQGYSQHDAEDHVQGFFQFTLSRDFLQNVTQTKGTFRTFLLRCLKNYLCDQYDKSHAAKRGGGMAVASLDETSEDGRKLYDPPDQTTSPDDEYDRAWAQAVLTNALRLLETECARQGHAPLCAELEPVLFADETAASYKQIAARLGVTEGSVTMAAYRIRNRLKGIIREEILHTVTREEDLQNEVRYLASLFGR